MASEPEKRQPAADTDANKAVRFLALKAAIFILVPLLAAAVAVIVLLK